MIFAKDAKAGKEESVFMNETINIGDVVILNEGHTVKVIDISDSCFGQMYHGQFINDKELYSIFFDHNIKGIATKVTDENNKVVYEKEQTENKKVFQVYLAGDMTEWRTEIIDYINKAGLGMSVNLINPHDHEAQYALGRYVYEDLRLVAESDLVFAYVKEVSPSDYCGTTAELAWAYKHEIPVILVNEKTNPHPFQLFFAKFVRTKLDSGVKLLEGIIRNESGLDYIK